MTAASLALGTADAVRADGAEAFVGGLLGSAIGTAITNQATKPRVVQERVYVRERAPRKVTPGINAYQRQENREVQTALNYFGYSAGYADGVMGANSRSAVAQYQSSVGFAPTGVLMENEKAFLLSSYQRALVGGPAAGQIVAASGVRGLLLSYRQEQLGYPAPAVAAAPMVVPVVVPPAPVPAPTVVAVQPAPAAAPEPASVPAFAAGSTAAVPSFMPEPAVAETLSARCDGVADSVRAAKGPIGTMDLAFGDVDPLEILDEQFCLARARSIDQARSMIADIKQFTAAEMRSQCEAFAPALAPYTAALPGQDIADARASVKGFVDGTGTAADQMKFSAQVCLGIAYSTDNPELALGSALVLDALGEAQYGELVGFQLVNGYGVPASCDCGLTWIDSALAAVRAGAAPLVPDSGDERLDVMAFAVKSLPGDTPIAQAAVPAKAMVPTFTAAKP